MEGAVAICDLGLLLLFRNLKKVEDKCKSLETEVEDNQKALEEIMVSLS